MKTPILLALLLSLNVSMAQFEQLRYSTFEEGAKIVGQYTIHGYYDGKWILQNKDLGIVRLDGGFYNDVTYASYNAGNVTPYSFDFIDMASNGNVVLSNYIESSSVAISQDGGESFKELIAPFKNGNVCVVGNNLYSFKGPTSEGQAEIVVSIDLGDSWQVLGVVPFNDGNSKLNSTRQGYPVYQTFNEQSGEIDLYAINGSGVSQLSLPINVSLSSVASNNDYIYIVAEEANNQTSLYQYDRQLATWTSMVSLFLPYSFYPTKMNTNSSGDLYVTGTRELVGMSEGAAYMVRNTTVTEINLPEAPENSSYESLVCENGDCLVKTDSSIFKSSNDGVSWSKLTMFNRHFKAGHITSWGYLFVEENYLYVVGSGLKKIQVPNGENYEILDAGDRVVLHIANGNVTIGYLWSSDHGETWNEMDIPYQYEIKSIYKDMVIVYSSQDNGYWWNTSNTGTSWQKFNGWDNFGNTEVIKYGSSTYGNKYIVLSEDRSEVLVSSDSLYANFVSRYQVSGKEFGGEILDLKIAKYGASILVKNVNPNSGQVTYEVLLSFEQNGYSDWISIGGSTQEMVRLATNWPFVVVGRDINGLEQLYAISENGLFPLENNLPEAVQDFDLVFNLDYDSGHLYLFTDKAGVWVLPRTMLGLEPNLTVNTSNSHKVYPNPISKGSDIYFDNVTNDSRLEVYSLLGELVMSKYLNSENHCQMILPEGTYVYSLINDAEVLTGKLIVVTNHP